MKFFLDNNQIRPLYHATGNNGCIASNRITVDGQKIGYMYREEPDKTFPDSGWRFFAGDESEEYTDNPDHFHIFNLNTICNYDESIIPYLDTPIGTAYILQGQVFVKDESSNWMI